MLAYSPAATLLGGRAATRRRIVVVHSGPSSEAQSSTTSEQQLAAGVPSRLTPLLSELRARVPVLGLCAATAATVLGLCSSAAHAGDILELPYYKPEITTESSKAATKLVAQLNDAGAKMYGAFWCSHCFTQKQAFGKDVEEAFPYIECYPDGWQRGAPVAKVCSDVGVRAFPSWVINERLVEGELTFEELQAELDASPGEPSPTLLAMEAADVDQDSP